MGKLPTNKPFEVTPTGLEPIAPEVADTFDDSTTAVLEKFGGIKAVPEPQPKIEEDPINPSHYRKHPSGIECIDVTRHLNFNIGNAIKYLWRHMDKGNPIDDLQKAQWYIDDEIRRLQGKR